MDHKKNFKQTIQGVFYLILLHSSISSVQAIEYDYIVVGAGGAGGPLASSLAEKGFEVLLVEAGELKDEDLDYVQIPALHPYASERPGISWQFFSDHYSDPERAKLDSKHCPGSRGCRADQNGVFYPRGSTVGGSSSVNAMVSVLPHDSDWNNIAEITGDSSWSAPAMREYFIKVERNLYGQKNTDGHGTDGWLSTNHNAFVSHDPGNSLMISLPLNVTASYLELLYGSSIAASKGASDYPLLAFPWTNVNRLRESSIPPLLDPNNPDDPGHRVAKKSGEPLGLYQAPVAVDAQGRRSGAAARVLNTLKTGAPLTLKTNALVTKVLFDDSGSIPKAIGIELLDAPNMYRADRNVNEGAAPAVTQIYAKNEIILSAGAFNTPQLLMLSGIGPRKELERHNIPVRVELPGVGANLQDKYEVPIIIKKRKLISKRPINFPALTDCNFDPSSPDDCYRTWKEDGRGVYSIPGAITTMIKKSTELTMDLKVINDTHPDDEPDLYIFGVGGTFKGYYPGYSNDTYEPENQFSWVVLKAHNQSRGVVQLRSSDPRDTPLINFKYFGDPESGQMPSEEHMRDLDAVVKGIRLARKATEQANSLLFATQFGRYEEVWPGSHVNTDEELRQFAMNESWGHHASSTAKIGASSDPSAVLDSRFKVYGTQGLRVVDASIFPKAPGFFPAVAIYMISEKAANVIAEDAGVF